MSVQSPSSANARKETEALRRMLEKRRQECQELLTELAPTAAGHIDPVALAGAASARHTLDQIDGALGRLGTGTYGACTRCGSRIPAARLEILPHTDSCIGCQELEDRR
jgi:DnaK suppressor protein